MAALSRIDDTPSEGRKYVARREVGKFAFCQIRQLPLHTTGGIAEAEGVSFYPLFEIGLDGVDK